MQNFRQFWTTSDFDREYIRKGLRYRKSENVQALCERRHVFPVVVSVTFWLLFFPQPTCRSHPSIDWKIKVVTQCLRSNILKTAGDTHLVTMEHIYETATGKSIGHITDHWSHHRWRHVTPNGQGRYPDMGNWKCLENDEIEAQYKWTTNSKLHMGNRMDTWPMMSRDQETSRSWPNYHWKTNISKTAVYFMYTGYPLIQHGQGTWKICKFIHL